MMAIELLHDVVDLSQDLLGGSLAFLHRLQGAAQQPKTRPKCKMRGPRIQNASVELCRFGCFALRELLRGCEDRLGLRCSSCGGKDKLRVTAPTTGRHHETLKGSHVGSIDAIFCLSVAKEQHCGQTLDVLLLDQPWDVIKVGREAENALAVTPSVRPLRQPLRYSATPLGPGCTAVKHNGLRSSRKASYLVIANRLQLGALRRRAGSR
mmetsp:Transcript_36994/g.81259  ORF Transcript_36994/g.81259 Transcript_36994/m.81259 type:complete len:209 (+) Transcript_36994:643-1269(+)